MKTITNYITEKANFLIKKHVRRPITSYKDLNDKDYYVVEYTTAGGKKMSTVAVFKKHVLLAKNPSVNNYISFDYSEWYIKNHAERHVETDSSFSCEKNDIVRSANADETELINSILKEYDFFNTTESKIIGTIKDNKFTLNVV